MSFNYRFYTNINEISYLQQYDFFYSLLMNINRFYTKNDSMQMNQYQFTHNNKWIRWRFCMKMITAFLHTIPNFISRIKDFIFNYFFLLHFQLVLCICKSRDCHWSQYTHIRISKCFKFFSLLFLQVKRKQATTLYVHLLNGIVLSS